MPPAAPRPHESRAVHIIGRYPPPIDGQSLATQNLADLLEDDYDVRRFNMTLPDRALLPSGLSGTHTVRHYLGLKPQIRERLSDGNPVLWANISAQPSGHWRDILSVLPCLQPAQTIVAVVHWGNFSRLFRHPATTVTAKRMIRRLNSIVALSQDLANQIATWIPAEKLHVIPNYVQPTASEDQLDAKRRDYACSKTLRVLFLSHMIREKGCYDLLEGIALAVKQGLAVEAHFAGRWNNSADEGEFHHIIQQHGLTEFVTVHGPIGDRSTVAKLHQTAHVFALPSVLVHEAQPLAIMEALSAGTPAIITKRPVFEALAGTGQGAFLVPPDDPEAIAEALHSLRNKDTWLRSSLAARKHYETAYSPESVCQLWINLIQNL